MASSKRVVRDETNVPAKMIVTLSASVTGLRHCGGTGQSTRPIHADPDAADDGRTATEKERPAAPQGTGILVVSGRLRRFRYWIYGATWRDAYGVRRRC